MNQQSKHKKIEVYTSSHCPYCVKAKALLNKKGVSFTEINVDDDALRQSMIEKTGGARSVPQIFIDDKFIAGGCDGLFERDSKGELDSILFY